MFTVHLQHLNSYVKRHSYCQSTSLCLTFSQHEQTRYQRVLRVLPDGYSRIHFEVDNYVLYSPLDNRPSPDSNHGGSVIH